MQLEDRFYTSTEVAEILGVSLRSVYRYLEDNKLKAEVKTATGRHRFTRQDILNFLYPDGKQQLLSPTNEKSQTASSNNSMTTNTQPSVQQQVSQPVETSKPVDSAEVDWLAKFREAANKYKEDQPTSASIPIQTPIQVSQPDKNEVSSQPVQPVQQTQQAYSQPVFHEPISQQVQPEPKTSTPQLVYYRSMLGGLKDIAQNIDKSARNSDLNYAFTLNAGASLHKPIKPFAILHAYINTFDKDFFEKILRLTPASESNAQLCLILNDDASIYSTKEEVHGLYVVGKEQLRKDINNFGTSDLAREISDILI